MTATVDHAVDHAVDHGVRLDERAAPRVVDTAVDSPVDAPVVDNPVNTPDGAPADTPADGAPVDAHVDGRTLRAQRTRDAVVESLLALQEEGDLNPTAQRVAARAGVALRTVYGHFSDMESLYLEAGRRELVKIQHLADVPPADLPLDERIARTAASRARTSEALLPVLRAARLRLPYSEALQRNWRLFIDIGDATVRTVFARELAAAGPDADDLVHQLYLVVSATAWDALRHDRLLEPDDAERVVRRGVHALLDPYA